MSNIGLSLIQTQWNKNTHTHTHTHYYNRLTQTLHRRVPLMEVLVLACEDSVRVLKYTVLKGAIKSPLFCIQKCDILLSTCTVYDRKFCFITSCTFISLVYLKKHSQISLTKKAFVKYAKMCTLQQ